MSEIAMEENRKVGIGKMFDIRGVRDKPRDSYGGTGRLSGFGSICIWRGMITGRWLL